MKNLMSIVAAGVIALSAVAAPTMSSADPFHGRGHVEWGHDGFRGDRGDRHFHRDFPILPFVAGAVVGAVVTDHYRDCHTAYADGQRFWSPEYQRYYYYDAESCQFVWDF